jgi:hypothetical protein
MKLPRTDLLNEAARYLNAYPDASANEVVFSLRCRRADGLRVVRILRGPHDVTPQGGVGGFRNHLSGSNGEPFEGNHEDGGSG